MKDIVTTCWEMRPRNEETVFVHVRRRDGDKQVPGWRKVAIDPLADRDARMVRLNDVPKSPYRNDTMGLRRDTVGLRGSMEVEIPTKQHFSQVSLSAQNLNTPKMWCLAQRLVRHIVRREPKPVHADEDVVLWDRVRQRGPA